ncbi:hypothetical protein FOL47_009566 [Perkinsus chesapeaki]|uniref:SCP domain-containing protein n=1 Tax=Perkinsus chesapeaki TaxID=330153 RepID=A0A7J6L7F6_PERCH|nr:hypothetical protein FOL47_009566 [Perkinsus chesapeaki]
MVSSATLYASLLSVSAVAQKFGTSWLNSINALRCMHNAGPLAWDEELARLSSDHARLMAAERMGVNAHPRLEQKSLRPRVELLVSYSGKASPQCRVGGDDSFNEHCATLSWYVQYDEFWKNAGNRFGWADPVFKGQMGNFFTLAFKGFDRVGCGKSGEKYVCQFGNSKCNRLDDAGCKARNPGAMSNWFRTTCGESDPAACVEPRDESKRVQCGMEADLAQPYSAAEGAFSTANHGGGSGGVSASEKEPARGGSEGSERKSEGNSPPPAAARGSPFSSEPRKEGGSREEGSEGGPSGFSGSTELEGRGAPPAEGESEPSESGTSSGSVRQTLGGYTGMDFWKEGDPFYRATVKVPFDQGKYCQLGNEVHYILLDKLASKIAYKCPDGTSGDTALTSEWDKFTNDNSCSGAFEAVGPESDTKPIRAVLDICIKLFGASDSGYSASMETK